MVNHVDNSRHPSAICHLVHYHYLEPTSPAFPRADFLVEALRARGLRVQVWCHSLKSGRSWGRFGERIVAVSDPAQVVKSKALYCMAPLKRIMATRKSRDKKPSLSPAGGGDPLAMLSRHAARFLFPDNECFWSKLVAGRLSKTLSPQDMVFTCSRPESVGFIGRMAKARGAFWWLDFADGWCWQGLRQDLHRLDADRLAKERELEKSWVASADGVSTVNNDLAAYFSGLRTDNSALIYPNLIARELLETDMPGEFSFDQGINILHFGRLRGSDSQRNLKPLLRYLKNQGHQGHMLRLFFYGNLEPADLAELEQLSALGCRVIQSPPVKRGTLPEIIAKHKINVMLVMNSLMSTGSTSKLLDAFGVGLPILLFARANSAAADLVGRMKAGLVIPLEENPEPGATRPQLAELASCFGYNTRLPEFFDSRRQAENLVKSVLACRDSVASYRPI